MKCDWYAATIPDEIQRVVSFLSENLGGSLRMAKTGLNGYANRGFLDDEGINLATLLWGGNNGANPHAFASSDQAEHFRNLVRDVWPEHSVTRVDVAEDMDGGPELFDDFTARLVEYAKGKRLSVSTVGDWLTEEAHEGRTLYLGSTSSPARVRLYEKGKQIAKEQFYSRGWGTPEGFPIDWVRLELQLRPQKAQKQKAATDELEQLWGYAGWTQDVAENLLSLSVPRVKGDVWKRSQDEEILSWVARQYGALFSRRLDALGGSWAKVGEELGQYVEQQERMKKRR